MLLRLGRERFKNTPGIIHPASFSTLITPNVFGVCEAARWSSDIPSIITSKLDRQSNLGERRSCESHTPSYATEP